MKSIPLTQGKIALVDDEDFEKLNQYKWKAGEWGNTFCARHGNTYMHRLIMNPPKGKFVDRINGNGLDNRRSNLRVCTHTENMRNRRLQKNNTTGFKGVSVFDATHYQVKIKVNGKLKHVGLFKDLIEAAKAWDREARKYFGKFARTNFPPEV